MRSSSRTLLGVLVVAVLAVSITLRMTRIPDATTPLVWTAPIPERPSARTRAPVVLDQPPVVVREPEISIAPTEPAPEPVVTHAQEQTPKDSVNLGRVRMATPEEHAEIEQKLDRFLQNQADARASRAPR